MEDLSDRDLIFRIFAKITINSISNAYIHLTNLRRVSQYIDRRSGRDIADSVQELQNQINNFVQHNLTIFPWNIVRNIRTEADWLSNVSKEARSDLYDIIYDLRNPDPDDAEALSFINDSIEFGDRVMHWCYQITILYRAFN